MANEKSYRAIISFTLEKEITDEKGNVINKIGDIKYLPLDLINSKTVNTSSQIVTQPLQSGDTMSDHMYRLPTELQLSGTFSLNGRNWNNTTYDDIMSSGIDRITSIQKVFEYIKNNGILCTIMTCATDIDKPDNFTYDNDGNILSSNINIDSTRFITRKNMALTNINWGEFTNYLTYQFTFKEVIMVNTITEYVANDLDLPYTGMPVAQSLGDVFTSTDNQDIIAQSIMKILYDNKYIYDSFIKGLVSEIGEGASEYIRIVTAASLIGTAVGIIGGAMILSSVSSLLVATSSVVPVGTTIAATAVIVGAVVGGIAGIIKFIEKRKKKKLAFGKAKNIRDDANRLNDLIDKVIGKISEFNFNTNVYQFQSDNPNQQICLSVGGRYYYITLTRTQSDPYWTSQISDAGFDDKADTISTKLNDFPVVSSIMDFDPHSNCWFKDATRQYQVYLCNPSLALSENSTKEEIKAVKEKLSSYIIYVSKGNINDNIGKLTDIISAALEEDGFEIK